MLPKSAAPRIVILKGDRLYGDLISRHIKEYWRNASVECYQRGFDALDSIQACVPDLFITGVKIEDMDGLEHLEPFIEKELPVLVVTSRRDVRTFALLRTVRYDALYDGFVEGLENLHTAMQHAMARQRYVSPTMLPHLKKTKNITLDALTEKEEMVLSVIGDGSDDYETAERLGLSRFTVNSHRKAIMRKLGFHQKGELMMYALQQGYLHVGPQGVNHPGFQRRMRGGIADATPGDSQVCA